MRGRVHRWVAALCTLAACGSKDSPPVAVASGSAPIADAAPKPDAPLADWAAACSEALHNAPKATAARRVQLVIDGCKPCGDWTPILKWSALPTEGGPTRPDLEAALVGCKAFCDSNAKSRFMGQVDEARGKPGAVPWHTLGNLCKSAVSVVPCKGDGCKPDVRYNSAPYFALDRIGRAAAADPNLATLLDGIELPLPAVSQSGWGLALPKSDTVSPDVGPVAITVSATQFSVGTLARATLGKDGVTVVGAGDPPYPGKTVKPGELSDAVAALSPTGPVALFAPSGMKASRLLETVALAGTKGELRLAVAAKGSPIGWTLAGSVPIDLVPAFVHDEAPAQETRLVLTDKPDAAIATAKAKSKELGEITIAIATSATVADLAKLLGALAYFDIKAVALVAAK